jgi:hypothetical protein
MGIFDIFKSKGSVAGTITIGGLPPHKMYSASVTLFPVASASSPRPFDGDPPPEQWTDTESVKEAGEPDDKPLRFRIQRPSGFYYLGVGVIAYLEHDGRMLAQVERFFPMSQPCQIRSGADSRVDLAVVWPDIPLDELHSYGTIHPQKS